MYYIREVFISLNAVFFSNLDGDSKRKLEQTKSK